METGTKMPVIPEYLRQQYRELVQAAHGVAVEAHRRNARRLRAVRHVQAARPGAVRVSRARAQSFNRVRVDEFPRARVPRRPRRDRRSGDHPSDPPRAKGRRRVSVVDVPAAHSVSVGAPTEDSPSAAARCCAARRSRCSSRRSRGRSSSGDTPAITGDRRARARRPARPFGEHGLRATAGRRRRTRAKTRRERTLGDRPRDARRCSPATRSWRASRWRRPTASSPRSTRRS